MDKITKQSIADLHTAVSELGFEIKQLQIAVTQLGARVTNLEG